MPDTIDDCDRGLTRLRDLAPRASGTLQVEAGIALPADCRLAPPAASGVWMAAAAIVMRRLCDAVPGLPVLRQDGTLGLLGCTLEEPAGQIAARAQTAAPPWSPAPDPADIDLLWVDEAALQAEAQARYPRALLLLPTAPAQLRLIYPAEYPETFIQALLRTLQQTAAAILADPRQHAGQIDLLGAAQRAELLALNPPQRDAPGARSVPARFAHILDAHADAPAVRWSSGQWRYADLHAHACRVAGALQARGIAPGDVVALVLDRTPQAIACMLGVLLAGAAYCPIDPGFPAARVAFMLHDSGARLAITQPETVV